MENNLEKLKEYFLVTLPPHEMEDIDLRIISDIDFAAELDAAETALLEDYLENSLSIEDRKLFETNYLVTQERQNKLSFIRSLKNFAQESSMHPKLQENPSSFFDSIKSLFAPPKLAFGLAGLALVFAIGASGYFFWKSNYAQSEVLVSLNKAYRNERPTEARITDFDYAPKKEGTRGSNKNENLEFVLAKSRATEAVLKNASAENMHELGRVYLAENNYDEAIKQFEKALKLNPNIAKLNNDLGVSFLEKGKRMDEGNLELFAKANEQIEKAIELDTNLTEAYFNRGLTIEALNLPNQAKEAWENYLKLDSTSKWADEARERLKKLELNKPISKTKEEILKEFFEAKEANDDDRAWQILSRNREMITGKLIPQQLAFLFVDSKSRGNQAEAKKALDALVYAGKLEEIRSGDLFWRDFATFNLRVKSNDLERLGGSLNLVKEGYRLRRDGQLNLAIIRFSEAKKGFQNLGNDFDSLICDYWIATLLYQLNEVEKSNSIHLALAQESEKKRYKWLAAQSYVRLSYGSRSDNKYSTSIGFLEKSLKLSNETQDLYNLQRTYTSLAFVYRILGRYDKSFWYSEKSLELQRFPESSSRQLWLDYEAIMEILLSEKLYRTAILFQNEALALDTIIKDEGYKQMSNNYLGMLYTATREFEKADVYFQESIRLAENFIDEPKKLKALSISKLKYANLKTKEGKLDEAISIYRDTIKFFNASEFQLDKYESLKGELLCYLEKNDSANIEEKLPIVLQVFNEYRGKILEEQSRNSFFDNEQSVYDIAVQYEFERANYEKAFDYAEESRSRSLFDLQNSIQKVSINQEIPEIKLSGNFSSPSKLSQIQAKMPTNTQLVVYSVLSERVLIWVVNKNRLSVAKTEISFELLQKLVSDYLGLVTDRADSAEYLDFSKQLHKLLIAPVLGELLQNQTLVIIPDKTLFRLPFNTLFSDRYLIQDFNILYSPSANIFINSSKHANELKRKSDELLLSIGNPTFNEADYDGVLQPLPSAQIEAEEVAKLYANQRLLTRKSATKATFLSQMNRADVIHFAGHYVIDEKSPLLSSFVLSGNNEKESNLANYQIFDEILPNARLIVLSGCNTKMDKFLKGEGSVGASRMFLAANIPLVVASQWAVDSEATKDLMIRFHQLRKPGTVSSIEALRHAQVEMLQNEKYNHPFFWAAFSAVGGLTDF